MKREDYAGRPGGEQLDCTVRAFTVLTQRPYAEVHAAFAKAGRKAGRRTKRSVTNTVAAQFGLVRVCVRRTVKNFLDDMQYVPRVAAFIRGHAFGVTSGIIADYEYVNPRAIVKFYYASKESV